MHVSKQWNKVSFGDIEVFWEARNAKPREADQDNRKYFLHPTHSPLDLNIVIQVVTSTWHHIYFLV